MLILEGCAAGSKLSAEGERQIVSLQISGDFIDLHSAIMKTSDHDMVAIGPLRVATVAHEAVLQTIRAHPGIALALWRETLADTAIAREWLLNVGRRDAYRRISHLMCEMGLRLEAIGLSSRRHFVLPLTQEQLGETTGLTAVRQSHASAAARRRPHHHPRLGVLHRGLGSACHRRWLRPALSVPVTLVVFVGWSGRALAVAAVAVPRLRLRFGIALLIRCEGAADVIGLVELALIVAPHIAFIGAGIDRLALRHDHPPFKMAGVDSVGG